MKVSSLILAAGSSERMGKPKQLLSYQMKTLLQRVIDTTNTLELYSRCLVLGHNADHFINQTDIPRDMEVLVNPQYHRGIGSSLKYGVKHIVKREDIEAILIMLCDQPLINTSFYRKLLLKAKGEKQLIIATSYAEIVGVPCIIKRSLFSEILEIDDGKGAKALISNHEDDVFVVLNEKAAMDVDTLEDYQKLLDF